MSSQFVHDALPANLLRRAFTLVEVICIVVILGVVAGLIVPRMASSAPARQRAKVNELGAMLSAAAVRHGSTQELQRLDYDAKKHTLSLMIRRVRGNDMNALAPWSADPLNPPITFDDLALAQTVADGQALDDRGWTLPLTPGLLRPSIEMLLSPPAPAHSAGRATPKPGGESWTLSLMPYSTTAEARRVGDAAAKAPLRSVDLDAAGLGDRPW